MTCDAAHRIELNELSNARLAHNGDGLIHAARLRADIPLTAGSEGGHLLQKAPPYFGNQAPRQPSISMSQPQRA